MKANHGIRAAMLGVCCLAGFAPQAGAQETCNVQITGSNDPAVDLPLVRNAVNTPATGDVTVCLSGTFDFGPPATPPNVFSVVIAPGPLVTSLRIVGLNGANGKMPTIRGGTQALTLPPTSLLPSLTIENLRFVNPSFSAISLLRANVSVRISGIHVAGVQSFLLPAFNARFREGVAISSLGAVTGDIEITESVFDGGVYGPDDATLAVSAGIALTGQFTGSNNQPFVARVRIADNRFVNWSGSAILAGQLTEATIERNWIGPGAFANLIPGCVATNGLGAANGISLFGVADSTVRDNVIVLDPALTSAGTPPACSAGITLGGSSGHPADGNLVYRNRIRGTGTHAFVVGAAGGSTETDNLYALNPVGNFTSTAATLLIETDATANTFVGSFPSVVDNGTDNVVITR